METSTRRCCSFTARATRSEGFGPAETPHTRRAATVKRVKDAAGLARINHLPNGRNLGKSVNISNAWAIGAQHAAPLQENPSKAAADRHQVKSFPAQHKVRDNCRGEGGWLPRRQ